MNIIILGAGQVGRTVAHALASEQNDITVVDLQIELLQGLQGELDIRTVVGHASSPRVLARAGARDADMIIAVTNSDETNMTACQVAHTLFQTPTKIARVRSADFLAHPELFVREAIPVDVLISPEQVVTRHLLRLVEYPAALQISEFAQGRVVLVGLRASGGGPVTGRPLRALADHAPGVRVRVAALFRDDRAIIPDDDTVVESDDELFFITTRTDIRAVASGFCEINRPHRRVIIAGGGNIGKGLAEALESDVHVKIIEVNRTRANLLAESLDRAVVLHGDATDKALLVDENIEDTDVFCAVTNDDEENIMSSMLAKRLGARRVIALINRQSYVELMEDNVIDVVVSPQQVTIGAILPHVRRGDVVTAHSLRRGFAEALEAVVHGDAKTSRVVGRRIDRIPLPSGTTIGGVVRGKALLIDPDTVIEADDHVILFQTDKRYMRELERLFQVDVQFL